MPAKKATSSKERGASRTKAAKTPNSTVSKVTNAVGSAASAVEDKIKSGSTAVSGVTSAVGDKVKSVSGGSDSPGGLATKEISPTVLAAMNNVPGLSNYVDASSKGDAIANIVKVQTVEGALSLPVPGNISQVHKDIAALEKIDLGLVRDIKHLQVQNKTLVKAGLVYDTEKNALKTAKKKVQRDDEADKLGHAVIMHDLESQRRDYDQQHAAGRVVISANRARTTVNKAMGLADNDPELQAILAENMGKVRRQPVWANPEGSTNGKQPVNAEFVG